MTQPTDEHTVTTDVEALPGGVRVRMTCSCGSLQFSPWPQAVDSIVEWQAFHLNIPHEQGKAKLRERLEREVRIVTCKHETTVEAAGLKACLDCGAPNPTRQGA